MGQGKGGGRDGTSRAKDSVPMECKDVEGPKKIGPSYLPKDFNICFE